MNNSVFKMEFGYYSKDGKFLGKKKPKNPQPGDFWVRKGPFGNPDIEVYDNRKYGYGTDQANLRPGYSNYRDHPSHKGSKGIGRNIPKALWQHASKDIKVRISGTGRENPRGMLIGASYKSITSTINEKGQWTSTSKDSSSRYHATKEQQKTINTYWKIKNKPPNRLNFPPGTDKEFDIAKARFDIWQQRRREFGGAEGKLFSSGDYGDLKDQYWFVSEGGYQEGMEKDGWTPPKAVSGRMLGKDGNYTIVPLSKIFANDPEGTLDIKDHVKYQELNPNSTKPTPIVSDVNTSLRVKPGDNLASTNGLSINQKKSNGSKKNNTVYEASESKTALNSIASYKQDATTSWGRGSFNTKGTTTNLTSRNERTLAYWSGDQKLGGMGYDFSKFKGDRKQLARDLRTGRAWETGKGTIIYQPDRGGMQVFKQRT